MGFSKTMTDQVLPANPPTFAERLRTAGIEPSDSDEMRLNKSLLMLATGLVCVSMMLWAGLYWLLGSAFSMNVPMLFLLLLAGNMIIFIGTRHFDFFRVSQLGLLLFLPFVAQWMSGNLITSSGIILWGLLGPIGAILCIGARQSLGWFIAWVVLAALSGAVDYYLMDLAVLQKSVIASLRTSLFFFTLNFISVAAISYALLLYSIEQKRLMQERLEQQRRQLAAASEAADNLMRGPVIFI
ncbi:MAG: hypothetical protein IT510_12050 [Sulfuritalea sp.]|jgi:adenylate cyclase|nr:hypothetical protein [Sulfuritalea sp.]